MYIKVVQVKSKLHHTWSTAAWLAHGLRYRPAILFRNLRFTALSFAEGKIRRSFLPFTFYSCL